MRFSSTYQPKNRGRKKGSYDKKKIKEIESLEVILSRILTEEIKDNKTVIEVMLRNLCVSAIKGNVRAVSLILDRMYGKPKEFVYNANVNIDAKPNVIELEKEFIALGLLKENNTIEQPVQ
jgi:hypothetical protein